jgi:hypothetical protein
VYSYVPLARAAASHLPVQPICFGESLPYKERLPLLLLQRERRRRKGRRNKGKGRYLLAANAVGRVAGWTVRTILILNLKLVGMGIAGFISTKKEKTKNTSFQNVSQTGNPGLVSPFTAAAAGGALDTPLELVLEQLAIYSGHLSSRQGSPESAYKKSALYYNYIFCCPFKLCRTAKPTRSCDV